MRNLPKRFTKDCKKSATPADARMDQTASPTRQIIRLAWPVLIAQLALMANSVIDTAMAGRLSAVDLAAVGIGASIMVTVVLALLSVLLALPPIIAQLYGAQRHAEIGPEIHQSVWISLLLALIAIFLLHHPGPFITMSQLQPAVEAKVRAYLDAASWGVPAAIGMRLFFGLSTGIGRPRPVMLFNLTALTIKVPLNAVFMYGLFGMPALGGPGCAAATATTAWIMATVAWTWCLHRPEYAPFALRTRFAPPRPKAILEFLKLGIPIGLTFIADMTGFTFMALFIARLGPIYSAAHQVAANLAVVVYMVPLALGTATAILVGQAVGAGERERARRISWKGIRLGMAIALVSCLVLRLVTPQIAALYTTDVTVQQVAIPLIMLVGIYHLGDALQVMGVTVLRSYKKTVVPMLIYAATVWGLGLGGGYLLGLTDTFGPARGAAGVWMAGAASMWLVGAMIALYLNAVSRAK